MHIDKYLKLSNRIKFFIIYIATDWMSLEGEI
jgi:hypothetical protein